MKNRLLALLFITATYSLAFSQTVTLDSAFESRCAASGEAYFSVSPDPAGSFWSIISGPVGYVPNPPQTLSTFTALPAGNYIVRYQIGGTIVDEPFTITGSYVDPVFSVDTIIDAYCPGQGEIHVSMAMGRTPYRYRLLHRDSAAGNYQPWTTSGIFDSLRAGTYQVQAEDSCGVLKTISNLVVDYPNGGPLGYDANGGGGIYHSDEAVSFPTSCTQTTVAMMFKRNYAYLTQNGATMSDGNGLPVTDHTDPNQTPLRMIGGQAPYTYTLTESEAYSFYPPVTDTFNDLRPGPPYSSQSSTNSPTYFALGRGIEFDVANDLTIYSMSMMGTRTGYNALIVLYDNAGNELYRKWEEQDANTVNDNVASLGWFVPAGTGYRMTVEAINSPGRLNSAFFATGVNYPISAGDITITGNADPTTDYRILNFFDAVVYSKNTTPVQGPDTAAIFNNVPRTDANSYTIVAEDGCGEKIYRSLTTKIPLEYVGMRRTAAECGIGTDRLFPDNNVYATLHQDVAQHYYTWPWRGNSIGGTLPYTYTVTSDIGYSPAPVTTDLAFCNPTNQSAYYTPANLLNLDGSQWQPTPGSTVTVNITDACGESITEVFAPPTGNIPVEEVRADNDISGCAPWRRYRIYHNPFVDTFENFTLNINPLTPGGAHARVINAATVDYFTPQYNYYQGASMRGNLSIYPYFLPGDYEITFTGSCSGNVVRDTITVTPSNFSFVATPIQPCSNTPTGQISVNHAGSELYTSPIDLLFAGNYDPSVNYATATPLDQSLIIGGISTFSGLAPGTYTVLHGTTNSSYGFLMNCAEYRTVTILPYKDPELSLSYDPSCTGPTGNIYASVTNGVPPYTYQWKLSTDPVSVYTTNSQTSDTIMGLTPNIYNVRVVDSCGQSTVRTVNTAAPFAVPPVVANDLSICEGSQLRINAIPFPGASYSWTKDGVPFGAPDTNVLIIDNTALTDSGDYTVIVSILPGCTAPPATSALVDVVSSTNTAIASAVPDRFCEGAGAINLTGGNTTAPTITSGEWTQVSGPTSPLTATITPDNMNVAVVTDISNTDGPPEDPYVFRWEITNGTCMSNAYDTVYIHRNPPTAYSGFDQNLCEQTSASLNATAIPFGFGYWTQVGGNPVNISDTTDPTATITGLVWPDTVTMRWTVINDSANATCVTSHESSLINYVQTAPSSVNAGPDDTSCGIATYTLQAKPLPVDSGTGKWVPISYPGVAPSISGNGLLPNSVLTMSSPGLYTLAWEVTNGICTNLADTVEIFYINANTGPDIIVCMDDTNGIRVSADTVPGLPGTWSSTSPSFNFTPNGVSGSDTALVSGFVAGTHTFTYTVTSGGCTDTDNLLLLASNPPSIADAGMDQLGLCQDTADLQANIPVEGVGVWTQLSGPNTAIMTDFDSAYNPIQGLTIGTYEFVWTISNQPCSPERDTVTIQVTSLPPTAAITSITNPTCILGGSITVAGSPSGSYEYSLDTAMGYQPFSTFNGLDTGVYRAFVRDLTNPACISRATAPVSLVDTLPGPTFDTAYFTPVSTCNGSTSRGSITAVAQGGNGTLTYNLTGSFTSTNTTGVFMNLLQGNYTIKVTDSIGCPLDMVTAFDMPVIQCDTFFAGISITGATLGEDTTCLPTPFGRMPDSIVSCSGSDGSLGGVPYLKQDSCIIFPGNPLLLPDPFTGDTACIVMCDTVFVGPDSTSPQYLCDTTTIIYYPTPIPDTTVTVLTQSGSNVVVCADTSQVLGTNLTYSLCQGASAGTFNQNSSTSNCYTYIPLINQIDTTCVIVCDENGICDTSVFVFIPSLSNDTVFTQDTVVCIDTTEMPAGFQTITGCDGNSPTTTTGGGTSTIDPVTGCVTTSPSFGSGLSDTTCIIVCDTVNGICDTTTIITVKQATPDTIVQLTNGGSVDSCLSTSELLGSNFTYSNCGSPLHGVLSNNNDTCFTYIPINNNIDSSCVIICDEYGICDTTYFYYIPPVTNDTIVTTDPVTCVDTNELMGAMVDSIVTCDGGTTTSNGGTVAIDPVTGCVTTTPDFTSSNFDTTCVIVCKSVAGTVICDTTIIVTVQPPTPDTVVQLTNGTTTDSCIATSQLPGSMYTYTPCGTPAHGTWSNIDSCYRYVPTTNMLDTACTIICDEYGICDTTIFIYVPPVTNDTIVTTDPVTCVDTNELMGAMVDSIVTCDGGTTTSNGGTVAIDPVTGCVTTTPDFTSGNTDTTCVVVCKSVGTVVVCDTTIIVTVQPPTPDTIIQLTDGNPTDTCLAQPELLGTMFTYSSCGNPTQGVLTNNNDTCFNYTPINNELDTSCVVICDEFGICDTTLFIYVPPVTTDTVYTLDTNVCVDTTELPGTRHTMTTCDGSGTTNNGGAVTTDVTTGCVTISPVFNGKTDTTCIIICDTVFGICDTTYIINMRRAMPDTIVECIPRDGQANDSNMNTNDLLGPVTTISVFNLPAHGQFTLTNDTNSSYQTSPFPILDTVQVSFCDEYNFCDTFTFIYIPPMTNDTIYTQGAGLTCVDTTEMPARRYTSIGTCDGMNMTSNGGTVVPQAGGCVDITPDFSTSNVDTTCVVLCDTVLPMCECDTTYVISFKPTEPDTFAIQLPKGTNTADTCLTTSELFGTTYTYRRLGAPTPHGPVTTHNDTCINYVQTSTTKYLDTARVLICDEYGNCDTTVIIYVPTPDPDTLMVGPVIPVTNVDTCVTLESTYMVGHYINTCDSTGTTSTGVPVTITGLCVRYPVPAPVFTGDTACIIVCDTIRNITICDTTLIVYLPDTTPPTVICKDDTVYLNNLGTVMIDTSNVLDTVYDNTLVHSVTVNPTMFNCSNVGPNFVTVTATDTNRNVDSCISTVTVLDTLPPTAICQNITIQLDSNGNASITALDVDGGSFDNCAIASMVVSQTSFDCSHLGMNTVTLTVTDIYGNVATCTATVTVEDNIAPIAYCPGDKQIVVRNTTCSYILPDYTGEASAWDNCLGNGVTITQTPAAGSEVFLENTDTTITITATDGSGNTTTCSFQLYARCVKELNIPQFISPDGNGRNDTWEIPELVNYPENTVKVFNRWGNLVFEQKGYYTGWDGRSNVDRGANRLMDNKMLPEGTYFYIIDLGEDSNFEPYVGYMQIKR